MVVWGGAGPRGMHTRAYKYMEGEMVHIFPWAIFFACSLTHLCNYFIDGKTITSAVFVFFYNSKYFLFQHGAVLLNFQNCYHNASSNWRAGRTRIYVEHMYLCENVCGRCIHKSISIYNYVHTYKN